MFQHNAWLISPCLLSVTWKLLWCILYKATRDRVVGWGTLLQAGRSWVRFPIRSFIGLVSIYLILPAALCSCSLLSLEQNWVPGIFLGSKGRPARKADNFAAICEPVLWEMRKPRRLRNQWVSTVCYTDSFTCLFTLHNIITNAAIDCTVRLCLQFHTHCFP
jgi:hypothetical protein